MTDQFEGSDEKTVRGNLARGAYSGNRAKLAQAWLQQKDQVKNDDLAAEQIQIARSSKNAAWIAAVAAILAALMAAISVYYSVRGSH